MDWILECPQCQATAQPDGLPTVCPEGHPWLVRYPDRDHGIVSRARVRRRNGMWRFREFLPITDKENPITLGEGDTPLLRTVTLGREIGHKKLWVKDEATNPTGSFKARGMSAAITRAVLDGATDFVLPTAGNAGVAASAYGRRAGAKVKVFAPETTPKTILSQIETFGGDLVLLDGHIGDCGREARAWAKDASAYDISTLKEPYRIEGKKTMGLELALQMDWKLPRAIIYPTGGGTGLIAMWKAFRELLDARWIEPPLPKMFTVQAEGCAPVVRAFEAEAATCEPWEDPTTIAAGLRVPAPLGGPLILTALRESGGGAVAVSDETIIQTTLLATKSEGIDFSPEGGAGVAAVKLLMDRGILAPGDETVVFNTGAGWLYR
jgi:threonine synthase